MVCVTHPWNRRTDGAAAASARRVWATERQSMGRHGGWAVGLWRGVLGVLLVAAALLNVTLLRPLVELSLARTGTSEFTQHAVATEHASTASVRSQTPDPIPQPRLSRRVERGVAQGQESTTAKTLHVVKHSRRWLKEVVWPWRSGLSTGARCGWVGLAGGERGRGSAEEGHGTMGKRGDSEGEGASGGHAAVCRAVP